MTLGLVFEVQTNTNYVSKYFYNVESYQIMTGYF